MLNSSTIRQIWLIIEEIQDYLILELNDSDLAQYIQNKLEARGSLNNSDLNRVRLYIYSRLPLFRDLSQSRLVCPVEKNLVS